MENQKDFIRGFNAGYQLEKHKPELAKQLFNGFADKDHPYAQGFASGVKEYARELFKERKKERKQSKERDSDFER